MLVLAPPYVDAYAQSSCVYANERGDIISAPTLKEVPNRFREKAACRNQQPMEIPSVDDVSLKGGERSSSFSTPIGKMEVRWPRKVEACFSRSPSRAITEAATAVNRAIRSARFDTEMRSRGGAWSLIFIDQANAVSQFPMELSLGGHPGFMVPPNQIYIVVDFISPSCTPNQDADARLLQVLLHEMGHVLEYTIAGERGFASDRKRAEGFAAWFESYSAEYATGIPKGAVAKGYRAGVSRTDSIGVSHFTGSAEDYSVAFIEFEAIVARRGVSGLMSIYKRMESESCSFYEALKREFGWDRKALLREVRKLTTS